MHISLYEMSKGSIARAREEHASRAVDLRGKVDKAMDANAADSWTVDYLLDLIAEQEMVSLFGSMLKYVEVYAERGKDAMYGAAVFVEEQLDRLVFNYSGHKSTSIGRNSESEVMHVAALELYEKLVANFGPELLNARLEYRRDRVAEREAKKAAAERAKGMPNHPLTGETLQAKHVAAQIVKEFPGTEVRRVRDRFALRRDAITVSQENKPVRRVIVVAGDIAFTSPERGEDEDWDAYHARDKAVRDGAKTVTAERAAHLYRFLLKQGYAVTPATAPDGEFQSMVITGFAYSEEDVA